MATFEENIATIDGTIYGKDLKMAIKENLQINFQSAFNASTILYNIRKKVEELEEKGGA